MRTTALLAALLLPVWAGAQGPRPATVAGQPVESPREKMVRRAFAKIVDAYASPEFQLWVEDKAPLAAAPHLAYNDNFDRVHLDCDTLTLTQSPDGTDAASTYCGKTPVVMIATAIFDRVKNEDELASTFGHELWHLIERHGEKRRDFLDPTCRKWAGKWLRSRPGREWLLTPPPTGSRLNLKKMCMLWSDEVQSYYQKQEADCDHWGVKIAELAGYQRSANREKWKRKADGSEAGSPYSTHPPADVRAWLLAPLDDGWIPPP